MMNNHSTSMGSKATRWLTGLVTLAALGTMAMSACDPNDPSELAGELEDDDDDDDDGEGDEGDANEIEGVESLVDDASIEAGGMGMTWGKVSHTAATGTDKVGCLGCNPYTGDTLCTNARPILCIKNDGSPNPGIALSFYNGWASGHIGLTSPVVGTALVSIAAANAMCVAQFGAGYRMAEHHDGNGGWNWNAYANINGASRFWTYINDQPGNCWN